MDELEIALEELDNSIKEIDNKFILKKRNNEYLFLNENNEIVAKAQYFQYDIPSFDWILIANVDTKKKYRRMGLATKLINQIFEDIDNNMNGVYVFVKYNNENAIKLYKKCKFKILKKYKLHNEEYFIMYRGKQSKINQFDKISFG